MANVTPRITPADKSPEDMPQQETESQDKRDDAPELRTVEPSLKDKIQSGEFNDDDADERGWIEHTKRWTNPDGSPGNKVHRVPVQHWPLFERHHNL